MRQSIGMSQQLNLIITFIIIVFALVAASLSYYKSFKINNVIVGSIEKYEGHNSLAAEEINRSLASLGYERDFHCSDDIIDEKEGNVGYCVYFNRKVEDEKFYSFRVVTYMYIDLPIINLIRIPITSNTKRIPCIGNNSCDI